MFAPPKRNGLPARRSSEPDRVTNGLPAAELQGETAAATIATATRTLFRIGPFCRVRAGARLRLRGADASPPQPRLPPASDRAGAVRDGQPDHRDRVSAPRACPDRLRYQCGNRRLRAPRALHVV